MRNFIFVFMTLVWTGLNAQTIIPSGDVWKYNDEGNDLGTAWREPGYDDSSWPAGNAQLGFGDGDENTVLESGHITYYFRKTVQVDDPSVQNGIHLRLVRDDGAIVYINGREVLRTNMPSDSITYDTPASGSASGADENNFISYYFPSDYLVQGDNTVAVEVHQRSASSSDVSFDLELLFENLGEHIYRKRPYLIYTASNTEMIILWQLLTSGSCTFEWGTDTTYASGSINVSEYGDDHQHRVDLSNLTPGTKYYYHVICDGGEFQGTFYAGAEDTDTDVAFYAYGDTRSQPREHNRVAEAILDEISRDPLSQTFIVNSGDLVAEGDSETDWDEQFFSSDYPYINRLLASLPYLAAQGNHERGGELFAKYFPYPMFENNNEGYYYSFDYGNIHFTVIDQFVDYDPGSTQYDWIENDLANTSKPWKIALYHRPGWSAGGHGNNEDVQNYLQPLFEQYHVVMAINGHNHYYARAEVNGVQHITTGGGGASLATPDDSYPNIVTTDRSYHFLKVHVLDDTRMHVDAIRSDGSVIESFDLDNPNLAGKLTRIQDFELSVNDRNLYVHSLREAEILLFDQAGRLLLQKHLRKGLNKITVRSNGIFLVYIRSGRDHMITKILCY
ncbi:MAG: metallophosphoesterase family protein [Chlorobi bacterium]|nr:metallophosphoesterase family protein [Chlorobiota bacterium]